jgi:hypothetical protein
MIKDSVHMQQVQTRLRILYTRNQYKYDLEFCTHVSSANMTKNYLFFTNRPMQKL